jgi:hypothetical protein
MVDAVKARIEKRQATTKTGKVRKVGKNAVLAIDVVMSASPEFFRPGRPESAGEYDLKQVKQFEDAALKWLEKEFGKDNIVSVVTHLDEQTPHIHATVVPITNDGNLSAKAWLDGKKALSDMQTRYADSFAHLGIQRGKIRSIADHKRITEYYANVNAAIAPETPDTTVTTPDYHFKRSSREEWAENESKRIAAAIQPTLQPLTDRSQELARERKRREDAEAEAAKLRRKIERDRVREIPLSLVFQMCGYSPDRADEHQYKTDAGRISIDAASGKKFFNHDTKQGGGGAIDLTMHLLDCSMIEACDFLGAKIDQESIVKAVAAKAETDARAAICELPEPDDTFWPRVKAYLTNIRKLPTKMIDSLHAVGVIFADSRPNACFKYSGGGVEIRGVSNYKFNGFRGKKQGVFWVGSKSAKKVAITESAIDSLSFVAAQPDHASVALSGNRGIDKIVDIVKQLELKGYQVIAAFDNDSEGDKKSKALIAEVPSVTRLKPKLKDWNDDLRADKHDELRQTFSPILQ